MRCWICTLVVFVLAVGLVSAKPPPQGGNGGGQMVNLPQTMMDSSGHNWMVFQQGWLQMSGNNPIYGQSAQMSINGNQPGGRGMNRARLDEKTGELIFDLSPQQGISVTRRVLLNKKEGYVRYIDVLKNTRQQDQSVNYQLTTNLNFGVNAAEVVSDPHKSDRTIGWVAQTDMPSVAVELYASKNAKVTPNIDWQPGNNTVTATYQVPVPAGKQAAILHIHTLSPSTEAGVNLVTMIKEAKVVADIPAELRKELVNFASTSGMVGDYEVLRGGELFDVVELRGGDQYKGTLQEPAYKLQTFYGPVELPADRVVGLINVGEFRPRQLLVTSEGEIFGGHLAAETIHLQLSSGQVTQIPLSQVGRAGYRKRAGEPEEWTLSKPMVMLRTGDRIQIELPSQAVNVATRYGKLALNPRSVSALVLASEEHGVHEILLADGSRFAGLVEGETFEMTLAGGKQVVKFPANAVMRIQFSPTQDADPEAAAMELTNGDKLVGQLSGQMKLDTSFDTITIEGAEVKHLVHPEPTAMDVQVTLWDDSTVSGQLQQPDLPVKLNSGVTLAIPAALIADYTQAHPATSPAMAEKIKGLVATLGADDYQKREQAEAELVSMGTAVVRTLRELKPSQSPEAQQRIESVLKQLEKRSDKPAGRNSR